jgi:hypothetical protein
MMIPISSTGIKHKTQNEIWAENYFLSIKILWLISLFILVFQIRLNLNLDDVGLI